VWHKSARKQPAEKLNHEFLFSLPQLQDDRIHAAPQEPSCETATGSSRPAKE
jgi:hypothetical protein